MQLHAFELGIGPALSGLTDVSGMMDSPCYILSMAFVEGQHGAKLSWTAHSIDQLANYLQRLHHTPPANFTLPYSVNKLSLLDDYWQQVKAPTCLDKRRFDVVKQLTNPLIFKNDYVIHGDLNTNNILRNANDMVWLDWEYGAMGDCYFDYAAIVVECAQNIEVELINSLEKRSPFEDIDKTRLQLFKLYYASVSWLWALMRGADIETSRYRQHVDQMITLIGESQISL